MLTWSGEGPLSGLRLLIVSSYGGRGEGYLGGVFYENADLILDGSTVVT